MLNQSNNKEMRFDHKKDDVVYDDNEPKQDEKLDKPNRRIGTKKLYQLIEENPNHSVIGVTEIISYRQMIGLSIGILVTCFIAIVLLIQYLSLQVDTGGMMLIAPILLMGYTLLVGLFLGYTVQSYLMDRTIYNDIAIAKEFRTVGFKGMPSTLKEFRATKWEEIEEIKLTEKDGPIKSFVLRSSGRKPNSGYRLIYCKGLHLKDLVEHTSDFQRWQRIETPESNYLVEYTKPSVPRNTE